MSSSLLDSDSDSDKYVPTSIDDSDEEQVQCVQPTRRTPHLYHSHNTTTYSEITNVRASHDSKNIRKGDKFYRILTDFLDLPEELWVPATTVAEPIARTTFSVIKTNEHTDDQMPFKRKSTSPLKCSETKGNRLLQGIVKYRNREGNIREGRVLLDTYSNVNYVAEEVAYPDHSDIPGNESTLRESEGSQ